MSCKNIIKLCNSQSLNLRNFSVLQFVTDVLYNNAEASKISDIPKSFKDIPGPQPYPILGNVPRFMPIIGEYDKDDILLLFHKFHSEFGDIVKIDNMIGQKPMVLLYKPEVAEMVYREEGNLPHRELFPTMNYFRENYRQDIFKFAKGTATSNGKEWLRFRTKVNPIMLQPKTVMSYVNIIDKTSKEFVEKLRKSRENGKTLLNDNLNQYISEWSLESIALIALEVKLNCMSENLDKNSNQFQLIQNVTEIFNLISEIDFKASIWKYIPTESFLKVMKYYDKQIDLSSKFVDEAVERIKNNGSTIDPQRQLSVLEKLLKIDKNVAIVMALDMLLAGVDTVATALNTVLYYLSINRDKQLKLREEILKVLSETNGELTEKSLEMMPYLKACLKEAQRIYPVGAGVLRELTKDTVILNYEVPKGTNVFFPHMYYSMMKENFVMPEQYIPERWLRENIDSEISYKRAHPFCFMPFGYGSRSCIGRRFAELELQIVLINLIKRFHVTWEGPAAKKIMISFNVLEKPYHYVFKDV